MERTPVESREIAIVGYDAKTSTLELTFRRGGVYKYFAIPESVHRALLASDSIGSFFADSIKDKYSYEKIS